jgi:hypothetical protein
MSLFTAFTVPKEKAQTPVQICLGSPTFPENFSGYNGSPASAQDFNLAMMQQRFSASGAARG